MATPGASFSEMSRRRWLLAACCAAFVAPQPVVAAPTGVAGLPASRREHSLAKSLPAEHRIGALVEQQLEIGSTLPPATAAATTEAWSNLQVCLDGVRYSGATLSEAAAVPAPSSKKRAPMCAWPSASELGAYLVRQWHRCLLGTWVALLRCRQGRRPLPPGRSRSCGLIKMRCPSTAHLASPSPRRHCHATRCSARLRRG